MAWYFITVVVLVGLDQWVKNLVVQNVALGSTQTVFPGVVSITHIQNNGAAWSILEGQQWFFIVVSLLALGGMLWFFYQNRTKWAYSVGLTLMIAGTFGNFIDRLRNGYVVDMLQLDFINFPIFNLADVCLTVGVIWLVIAIFRDGEGG